MKIILIKSPELFLMMNTKKNKKVGVFPTAKQSWIFKSMSAATANASTAYIQNKDLKNIL